MRSITCPRKRAKITSHFAEDDDSGSGASCTVFSGLRPLFYQVVGSDPEFRKRCTKRLTHFCKMRSYFCALPSILRQALTCTSGSAMFVPILQRPTSETSLVVRWNRDPQLAA